MKPLVLNVLRTRTALVVAALVVVLSAFGTGLFIGSKGNYASSAGLLGGATPPPGVDFSPLWKAWSVLQEKYVAASTTKQISDDDKLWGTIKGLAGSYGDPYTVFMPPEDASLFEEDIRGSFGGVGMEVGERDNTITVIAPLKGTPAARAGILAGDKIIEIDGTPTDSLSVDEAVKKIRGDVGTKVEFTIFRQGEREVRHFTVTREIISVPAITTTLRPDKIFVIELHSFSATSPDAFKAALKEFADSKSDKLVIDLRGNPGGYLEAAVDIASWFLPSGKVVVTEDFGGDQEDEVYRSRGYDVFTDQLKLAILVNGGSASASEILAGALSEHKIGTLIGETTFGKGSVQELIKITSDTALKVTVARWLTPNGTSISNGGLKPDIEVKMTPEDIDKGRDPQMDRAAKFLLSK